jgi:hypothetical protein
MKMIGAQCLAEIDKALPKHCDIFQIKSIRKKISIIINPEKGPGKQSEPCDQDRPEGDFFLSDPLPEAKENKRKDKLMANKGRQGQKNIKKKIWGHQEGQSIRDRRNLNPRRFGARRELTSDSIVEGQKSQREIDDRPSWRELSIDLHQKIPERNKKKKAEDFSNKPVVKLAQTKDRKQDHP